MARAQKTKILPAVALQQVRAVTDRARENRDPGPELGALVETLSTLSAHDRQTVGALIQEEGRLYQTYGETGGSWIMDRWARAATRDREINALRRAPLLANLYIFHGDGYVREAALDAWPAPPASPLMLAAIADRLNDWVPEVRAAARRCAEKWFPSIAPEIVAEAFDYLVGRQDRLKRWGPAEQQLLERTLYRDDVVHAVATRLCTQTTGPASRILRAALRRSGLDKDLPRLANEAALPSVRAAALEVLLAGRARWRIGTKEEWIDKRYGKVRWVPILAERPIANGLDVGELLLTHSADKAPVVRKAVAAALIDRLETPSPGLIAIAQKLAGDRSAPVARKAQYFLKNAKTGA